MHADNKTKNPLTQKLRAFILMGLLFCVSAPIHALDNPDAPDHISDFLNRAQVHEQDILRTAHTTQSYITAYAAYETFLDKELDAVYAQLMQHMPDETRQALQDSQRKWLNYRDTEFDFIAHNWTTEKFGSSAVISRGDYRIRLIKDRIMLLLQYLRNY